MSYENKFGPGWRAWWKGDEVGRAMKSAVSQGLREMAYQTRELARASIIRRGWGMEPQKKTTRAGEGGGRFSYTTLAEIKKYKTVYRRINRMVMRKGKPFELDPEKMMLRPNGADLTRAMKKGGVKRLSGLAPWLNIRFGTGASGTASLGKKTRVRVYRRSKPGETPTNQRGVLRASILYGFREQDGLISANTGPIAQTNHWSMTNGLATHALEYGGWTRNHAGKSVHIAARPFMRPAQAQVVQSDILKRQLSNSLIRYWAKGPVGSGWTAA